MSKTVRWKCPDCPREYDDEREARACCGGDPDDRDDADGIAYDYHDGMVGVVVGP